MTRGVVAAALLAALVGCRERDVPPDARPGAAMGGGTSATTRILYPSAPGSFVDLVAGARHGVVAIRAPQPVKSGPAAMFPGAPEAAADVALGTGFLVEANGVYVLTNDHIAAASNDLRVVLDGGQEVAAKVIGRDTRLDVALLSIDVPRLQALQMGDSDDLRVGEWLVVLGDPFGDEVTASVGVVSATGREAAGSLTAGRTLGFRTYLQTDARIHRGNSGGPVLDTSGQVVGIAVATSDRPGELSFVVPIARVKEVLGALRDVGTVARSWLGATVKQVTKEIADQAGLAKPTGAMITDVRVGSPAARYGLRVGDVVTKWDDREVDHRSMPWAVAETVPGKTVAVTIVRNKVEQVISVVTERMPE
jgi:serine protease Do